MRPNLTFRFLLFAVFLAFLAVTPAMADELAGRIRGTVTDPTGAVIPDVQVTATNVGTGISNAVNSASDGSFEFLHLPAPATYTVSAERSGFKRYSATGISLALNQIYVLNIQLELGQMTQQVTVEAAPAQVETTSMQLGATISGNTIVDLPLNGRNWVTLQQTLPGVVATSNRFATNYSTSGAQNQQNSYMINGTDAMDMPLNTPLQIPSPDAIAEVRMITNTINPEYGRNSGAIMNAVTKSGTNEFHGSAFDFFRDTSLNARNFFKPRSDIFHQHQFGGTIGGPIWQNHTFFFFSYQGTRNRSPQAGGTVSVFTPDERNGIFPALASSTNTSPFPLVGEDGTTYPADTPYNVIFPTGQIPAADFNSVSKYLMDTYVPLPNFGAREYSFNPIQTNTNDQEILRFDHNIGTKDTIWAYWFIERNRRPRDLPFTGATLPGFGDFSTSRTQQYTLAWNHTFAGTMLNEVRIGYSRLGYAAVQPQESVLPSSAGFTGINPQNTDQAGLPYVSVSGLFRLGFSYNGPQPRIDQTYQFTDNFSWVKGRHTLKFGFEMRRFQVTNPFYFVNNGYYSFSRSAAYSTGTPGADFLLGIPSVYEQSSGGFIDARAQEYYTYAQDQFKVRPNLTLTYGVGWQIDTPIKDIFNGGVSLNCFAAGQQSSVFADAPAGLLFPGDPNCNSAGGATTHPGHFGPRFGFAWSPGTSRKWSLRGGFGVYFNRGEEELTLQNLLAPPFSLIDFGVGDIGGNPSFADPWMDITGAFSIPNKYPFNAPQPGSSVDFGFYEPFSLNLIDPQFSIPYAMNYNLTLERELPGATILSIAYVGSQGRKLYTTYEGNPGVQGAACAADPTCVAYRDYQWYYYPEHFVYPSDIFGSLGWQATSAVSNYNSLQVSLNKRTGHGLTFLAAWTYSHSLDTSSGYENSNDFRGVWPLDRSREYGDSAFDARHRFVISGTYQIPTFESFRSNAALNHITGGWRVVASAALQTGFPITLADGDDRSLSCAVGVTFYGCPDRPDVVGTPVIVDPRTSSFVNTTQDSSNTESLDHYIFDPNTFALEPFGQLGNSGRNFFHGAGINNVDFALFKEVRITEQKRFELRFEFFNFFNHTQFLSGYDTDSDIDSSNFGRILSARDPRIIQLAAKFYF
jgi:hypothetical protein